MTEDTKTAAMVEFPARLQMSMLAPVKAMAEKIPEGDKEVRVVGYVFGEARGVSFRNNPNSADGEAAIALVGVFEGQPAYVDMDGIPKCADRARLQSGVLFLPPQAQAVVVNAVRDGDKDRPETPKRGQRVDQLGVTVPISFEIGIRKSSSPVGYEWVVRGLANVEKISPLDRMRKALNLPMGANLAARIEDGTLAKIETGNKPDVKAIAGPKSPKAKGKR